MTRPLQSHDPLASLLIPGPGAPGFGLSLRTGRVVSFNASTGANSIAVDGTVVGDVSVLDAANTAGIAEGDQVSMLVAADAKGVSTYLIIGRAATPDLSEARAFNSGGYRYLTTVVIESDDTFSRDNYRGGRLFIVHCVGGGGAGGGVPAAIASQSSGGSGGGGGSYARSRVTYAQLAAGAAVSIGAGGTGASGAAGGGGGTTSFGSFAVAAGGGGGNIKNSNATGLSAIVGDGGTPTTGDIKIYGNPGHAHFSVANLGFGGNGGAAAGPYGGGGGSGARTNTNAQANGGSVGGSYGGGGAGGIGSGVVSAAAGANGAKGVCIVDIYS